MSLDSDTSKVRVSIAEISIKSTNGKYKWIKFFIYDGSSEKLLANSTKTIEMRYLSPQTLSPPPEHYLLVKYHRPYSVRDSVTKIKIQELLEGYKLSPEGKQEWKSSIGKSKSSELVVTLELKAIEDAHEPDHPHKNTTKTDEIRPQIDELLEDCPSFRILVIGKTGAGKSSIINRAFGVEEAMASHKNPGEADINKELRSPQNSQFVLHDSLGFEHGEVGHLKKVVEFIQDRSRQEHTKDKLHAIWLCLEIPTYGGRLFETGIESFLDLKIKGDLGEVPVIIVFTKYDLLVNNVMLENLDEPASKVQEMAQKKLQAECIDPFEKVVQGKIPHITVTTSTRVPEYHNMLPDLVRLTFDTVSQYLEVASILTGIAQKINPAVKIETIISVGKRKYWNTLASGLGFPEKTIQRRLDAIHTDIVEVWKFNDPNKLLISLEFRALISNGVDFKQGGDPTKALSVGVPMISALAGLVTTVAGPAAPIVLPIAAAFVLAYWVHQTYLQSQAILQRLMTYIVDLTLITQNLFWIQRVLDLHQKPVSRRLIKAAFNLHIKSEARDRLLVDIIKYCDRPTAVINGAGATFSEIARLVRSCTTNPKEAFPGQDITDLAKIQRWAQEEEDWDARAPNAAGKP